MILRKATLSDLDSIMKVEASSFIPEIQEEREVFKQRILRCPELFLVFEQNGEQKGQKGQTSEQVMGYLSAEFQTHIPETASELKLGHIPSENSVDSGDRPYIYISSFALLPQTRGAGLGKMAWEKSLELFRKTFEIKGFLLLVNEAWKGARHIYEQNGFKEITVFSSFFSKEDGTFTDGILMIKE